MTTLSDLLNSPNPKDQEAAKFIMSQNPGFALNDSVGQQQPSAVPQDLMTSGSQPIPLAVGGNAFDQAAARKQMYGPDNGADSNTISNLPSAQGPSQSAGYPATQTTTPTTRVLDQMRQRDGSIFQLIEQDTPRGTVKTTRVVMPDSVNPYVAAQTKMEQGQATLAKTRAETARLNMPTRNPNYQEIIDPNNPAQMIRVDANAFNADRYKAGDKTGFLGVSGKEPAAAKRDADAEKGMTLLTTQLDGLRSAYGVLNTNRAIPSDQRSAISNAGASVQTSTPGQMLGRFTGTQEQSLRNEIQSSRLLLLRGISQATGMSAKNLDSNTELKMWLSAVTDPSNSYESNMKVLDNIEKFAQKNAGKYGGAAPAQSVGSASKEITMEDVFQAAKKTGKSLDQVRQDAQAKGYRIRGM